MLILLLLLIASPALGMMNNTNEHEKIIQKNEIIESQSKMNENLKSQLAWATLGLIVAGGYTTSIAIERFVLFHNEAIERAFIRHSPIITPAIIGTGLIIGGFTVQAYLEKNK